MCQAGRKLLTAATYNISPTKHKFLSDSVHSWLYDTYSEF